MVDRHIQRAMAGGVFRLHFGAVLDQQPRHRIVSPKGGHMQQRLFLYPLVDVHTGVDECSQYLRAVLECGVISRCFALVVGAVEVRLMGSTNLVSM